jgi:DNA-binding NtrC family response regulator
VTTVANGNEAMEYLSDKVYLHLLDMIMEPNMNGRKTLERVLEIWPDQKTIIVTEYAGSNEVKKACALGNTELISKPYTMQHLSEKVKIMLTG